MTDLTSATKTQTWLAWAGTRQNAEDVFAIMFEATQEQREGQIARATSWPGSHLRSLTEDLARWDTRQLEAAAKAAEADDHTRDLYDGEVRRYAELVAEQKAAVERARSELDLDLKKAEADQHLVLRLTEKTGRRSFAGTAERLGAYLDPRVLRTFDVQVPRYAHFGQAIQLEITDAQLRLTVTGHDEAWTTSTFANLVDEISKSKPWWYWLRGSTTPLLGIVATSFLGMSLVSLVTIDWIVLFWLIQAVVVIAIGWGGQAFVRRIIPTFEVVEAGAKPRGAAAVAVIAGLAAELVLGIYVNLAF